MFEEGESCKCPLYLSRGCTLLKSSRVYLISFCSAVKVCYRERFLLRPISIYLIVLVLLYRGHNVILY